MQGSSRLASVLRDAARATDTVARWGGEEFLVVLPGGSDAARTYCERIRGALTRLRVGPVDAITISAGIASMDPDEPHEAAIRRADTRLYEAKRGGRDRVV